MRLFLLSIVAIGSVHSLTIGYPYRSALLAYSPSRGEFPVHSSEVQGYLRYFDNNGVEHLVSYSHPEPTLGVRYVAGVGSPVIRANNIDLVNYPKAIEGHFRAWIAVQYKALKAEIDSLNAQGKAPSFDMLTRLQTLEKIYQTADFSTISGLPEVKRLFDEHSRIYKVRTEFLQQPQISIAETPEQKKAREEHVRLYNEQIARLRQIEAQREETNKETSGEAQPNNLKKAEQLPINRLAGHSEGITEIERATQEHLRLWNEAKLRTLDTERNNQFRAWINNQYKISLDEIALLKSQSKEVSLEKLTRFQALEKMYQTTDLATIADLPEVKRLCDEFARYYNDRPNLSLNNFATRSDVPQLPVSETPEQKKAREEYLRIINEQVVRGQEAVKGLSAEQQIGQSKLVEPLVTDGITEVERATQEHLRLWNEARARTEEAVSQQQFRIYVIEQYKLLRDEIDALRAQSKEPSSEMLLRLNLLEKIYLTTDYAAIAESVEVKRLFDEFRRISKVKPSLPQLSSGDVKSFSPNILLVQDKQSQSKKFEISSPQLEEQQTVLNGGITEVERATQEHLRLWNEAKLNAEKSNYSGVEKESTINKEGNFALIQSVQEPEEIQRARAEHLRLLNEATYKVQNSNTFENKKPIEHQQYSELKTIIPEAQQQVQQHGVVETPEVVRAREEHLRLVNEARLRAQSVEQEELKHKSYISQPILNANIQHLQPIPKSIPAVAQVGGQPDLSVYTPEVIKARDEHLRLVNEAQQQNVQSIEQSQIHSSGESYIVETPEVVKARQEHLRIFNEIKSHAEKEQAKLNSIKASGSLLKNSEASEDLEKVQEQERLKEEARLLELERLREADRLQEEKKQFELEQLREAERLAEEQRQMEAELIRLKLAEEKRLEMEKLIEARLLKADQEQAQQIIITEEYKPIEGTFQDPLSINSRFGEIPTDEDQRIKKEFIQQTLTGQQPIQQVMYAGNPFLNSAAPLVEQNNQQQPQQLEQQQQHSMVGAIVFPSEDRKIQSSQNSYGSKQQHIKEDFIKHQTIDHASFQPADTAAVLIHLEKARQEHLRAYDQALEQLRLARGQSSSLKDCN